MAPMKAVTVCAAALLLLACSSGDGSPSPSGTGGGGGAAAGGSASGGTSGSGGSANGGSQSGGAGGSSAGAGGGGGGATKKVGDPCTADAECPAVDGTTPVCLKTLPNGGACSATGCAGDDLQCASEATCVPFMGADHCMPFCHSSSTCRTGYTCSPDTSACVPGN
jgi:hypothetical protein